MATQLSAASTQNWTTATGTVGGTTPFSLMATFVIDSQLAGASVISAASSTNWWLQQGTGPNFALNFYFAGYGDLTGNGSGSQTASVVGQLYRLLCTYSGTSAQYRIWDHGTLVAERTSGASQITSSTGFDIGRRGDGIYWTGRIAELAIYNGTQLGAAEAADYGAGWTPDQIRPDALTYYWPLLWGDSGIDVWGGNNLTPSGGPTEGIHPPMVYPSVHQTMFEAAAGPAPTSTATGLLLLGVG